MVVAARRHGGDVAQHLPAPVRQVLPQPIISTFLCCFVNMLVTRFLILHLTLPFFLFSRCAVFYYCLGNGGVRQQEVGVSCIYTHKYLGL